MNWNAISFDWNQARAFLAVAEESSLSAAAAALRVTQPTITRQIAALEKALNVSLFERSGRSVSLTPSGLELLDHVRAMATGANQLSLAASGKSQAIDGRVRISASDMTAAYLLPPILTELRQAAPQLKIDIVADNNVSDLIHREADIAVRHIRPEHPDLIGKLICEDTMRFYAVPAYTEAFGHPKPGEDLSNHRFISFGDIDRMLGYLVPAGLKLTRENFQFTSQSQVVECQIAKSGHGIAIMTDRIAATLPEFEPVLTEMGPFKIPVWLVAHRELQTSRRIRIVFDILAKRLSAQVP